MWFGTYHDLSRLVPDQFFALSWTIPALSWKHIADIWSWLSGLALDLQQLTTDSSFTLIDPILTNATKFDHAYQVSRDFMQSNLALLKKKLIMYDIVSQWGPGEFISDTEQSLLDYYAMSRESLWKAFSKTDTSTALANITIGCTFYNDRIERLTMFDSLVSFQQQHQWITIADSQDAFGKNSFDVIFMTNLLSHIDTPISFLQKTVSLLTNGWYIILTDYLNIGSLRFLKLAAQADLIKKIWHNDKLVSYRITSGAIQKIIAMGV